MKALLRHRLTGPTTLQQRLAVTVLSGERLAVCQERLSGVLRRFRTTGF
jgi:hypothetical protein